MNIFALADSLQIHWRKNLENYGKAQVLHIS